MVQIILFLAILHFGNIVQSVLIDGITGNSFNTNIGHYIPTVLSKNISCKSDSDFYVKELQQNSLWAAEMFDAGTKYSSGFLYGSSYDFGNFDECLEIFIPKNRSFVGKYCLIKFTIHPKVDNQTVVYIGKNSEDRYFYKTVWDKLIDYSKDPSKNPRNIMHVAYCIPSSCTQFDLRESLAKVADDINEQVNIGFSLEVDQLTCRVASDNFQLDFDDVIFISVIIMVVCNVVLGSLYYSITNRKSGSRYQLKGKVHDVLLCFSVQKNVQKLCGAEKTADGLDCTAGMKVFSMILIITLHRNMYDFGAALLNPKFVEKLYMNFGMTFMLNGPILVDTFFTISGFLATYFILCQYEITQQYNILKLYIHRYVRLTSLYVLILAFYCTLFAKLGSGPLWRERVEIEREKCRKSWWANLLYINNYVNTANYCMFQSWYLACDMNAFWVVPLITLLIYKRPLFGMVVTVSLLLISITLTFTTIYVYNEMPILIPYMKMMLYPSENSTFLRVYIPGHIRASSYLVGVMGGYYKYKIRNDNLNISPKWLCSGWMISVGLLFSSLNISFVFFTSKVPTWFSALYGAFYHVGWSLGITWIVIVVSSGHARSINSLLTWHPIVVLSRLTYSVYLCHGIIQMYSAGSIRTPIYASTFNTIHAAVADLMLAYSLAFVIAVVFEAPIICLEKLIWKGKKQQPNTKEENCAHNLKNTEDTTCMQSITLN